MHFGQDDIDYSNFDYRLPVDTPLTIATFKSAQAPAQFQAYVGAPKWRYQNWKGQIYPRGTKEANMLDFYARQFTAVELNATFYELPPPERVLSWKDMVKSNPGFMFCPKFPQSITHIRRFRNTEALTDQFYSSIALFGEHLGPVFLQLADNFTPNAFEVLSTYLATLPTDFPLFLEVRNKNFFALAEHRYRLFDRLRSLNIGSVITDAPARRDAVHMELTTPHAFIRFVHCGNERIDFLRLDDWVMRLKDWKQRGLQSLWFFIHGGDEPSLMFYHYLIPKLNRELGVQLNIPGEQPV